MTAGEQKKMHPIQNYTKNLISLKYVQNQDNSLTVCVVTTVAGTCRTVAVAVPSVRGEPEAPGATVIPLALATTLAAMVTTLAHVDAVSGLPPVVVVIVMV